MSDTHLRIAQIIFNLIDFFISYPSINVHSIRLQMDAHYNRKALHYIFDPLLCVCVFAFGEIWYSGFMIVWTINMERLVSFRFISFLFIRLFDLNPVASTTWINHKNKCCRPIMRQMVAECNVVFLWFIQKRNVVQTVNLRRLLTKACLLL